MSGRSDRRRLLTEQQLALGPDVVAVAPQVIEGALDAEAQGAQLTWITWLEVEAGIEGIVDGSTAITWAPSRRRSAL